MIRIGITEDGCSGEHPCGSAPARYLVSHGSRFIPSHRNDILYLFVIKEKRRCYRLHFSFIVSFRSLKTSGFAGESKKALAFKAMSEANSD